MALCVQSDILFVFGSYPKVLQSKYHSKLGVVNSLPVTFLMDDVVTRCYFWFAHDSLGSLFFCFESGQKLRGDKEGTRFRGVKVGNLIQ